MAHLDSNSTFSNADAVAIEFSATGNAGTDGAGDMSDVVDDTSPQLGGDLDVQTNSIVSTSNRNIAITPNGTGDVIIGGGMNSSVSTTGKAIVFGF